MILTEEVLSDIYSAQNIIKNVQSNDKWIMNFRNLVIKENKPVR